MLFKMGLISLVSSGILLQIVSDDSAGMWHEFKCILLAFQMALVTGPHKAVCLCQAIMGQLCVNAII